MAIAERIPEIAPVSDRADELVCAYAEQCREENLNPSDVVLWEDVAVLDRDLLDYFARAGIVQYVGMRITAVNGQSGTPAEEAEEPTAATGTPRKAGRRPIHAVHGRNPHAWRFLEGVSLCGHNNARKRLINFTEEDLIAFESEAANYAETWTRKRDWAQCGREALREHGCTELAELPPETLRELDTKASLWA